MQFELTIKFIKRLKKAIATQDTSYIKQEVAELHPADVHHIILELNDNEVKFLLTTFDQEFAAEVITEFDDEYRNKFLKNISNQELSTYIEYIESDDAVDIIEDLSDKDREAVITLIRDTEKAKHITELLRYDEDTAGGLMAKEMIVANVNWNVNRCIDEIRQQRNKVERIHSIYVVDDNNILLGRVSLKKLILASDSSYVRDLYEQDIVTVHTHEKDEDVANVMSKYDLTAIPVVNIKNQLLGRITVDDIVDVVYEHAEEDLQLMSGISVGESIEHDEQIWASAKARLPWLLIGISGGFLAAYFISLFNEQLIQIPIMASFIPLIMATGGNVGVQSSTIVVQSLANKNGLDQKISEKLINSLLVALINGLIISGLVFGFNLAFQGDVNLAFVISMALFSVVILASTTGTITPIILDRMNINPALASGPFITTANDLLGISVYFGVAAIML